MEGQLEQRNGRWQLTFVRKLPHSPEKVWKGSPSRNISRAGFPEGPTTDGRMVTYDPPSVLELDWGGVQLRFELRADGAGTMLTFVDTFDQLGKAADDAAGWHTC